MPSASSFFSTVFRSDKISYLELRTPLRKITSTGEIEQRFRLN